MGQRRIIVKESDAFSIAQIAWFIESKGMVKTAEKFSDDVYNFVGKLSDKIISHALCKDSYRKLLGLKCIPFKKKFTIVFWETEKEIILVEFIVSKLIH